MKTLLLLLIITLTVSVVHAQSPPAEKRLALVMGNGNYAHNSALPKATNDADDMAATLTQLGFEVLMHKDVNKPAMQRAIGEFNTKLAGYSVGLVYYAGHGTEVNGRHFMAPTDANPTNAAEAEQMCLTTNQLITGMAAAKAQTNIVILDTDRTNPFDSTATLRRTSVSSLHDVDTPIGFVVAYATAPGRPAIEGTGRNGLYTGALLKAMIEPNQPLSQLFQTVRGKVLRESKNKQIPWESMSLTKDFYFLKK